MIISSDGLTTYRVCLHACLYADCIRADSPRIECQQLTTPTSDVTRVIQCDVTAKPGVVNMFWIIDENGTTLADASGHGDIWTSSTVR